MLCMYICVCIHIYIYICCVYIRYTYCYIYIYMYTYTYTVLLVTFLHPISLLRLSLLRFVDSTFPRKFPMDMRTQALKLKIMLESNPLKSRIVVQRLPGNEGRRTHRWLLPKRLWLKIVFVSFNVEMKIRDHLCNLSRPWNVIEI